MEKCLKDIVELIRGNETSINVEDLSKFIRYELEKKKTTFQE